MSIKVVDYLNENASQQFTEGLKEIGFAVIANHPISQRLIDDNYAGWKEFFHLPEREMFIFDPKRHDGYASAQLSETAKGYGVKDLKEFYHYYPHGRCPDCLRPITQRLYEELTRLASVLLRWIEKHAPLSIQKNLSLPLSEMIRDSHHTLLRIAHYPPLTGQEPAGALRAAPHEDINLLTLLPAATAEGLQVLNSQGQWIEVPLNPNWIVVNIGDMLEECTEHYYPSTKHRVINPSGEQAKQPRLSMPLFLHPRDEVILSGRHTAATYRLERFRELGLV
ncbi:MAG TPA: 2OG-Fe(II) oxygenase family protein [Coxiellaceae bacterium]|nr:2OG-Fe(II) oxygenase family protein [Coxiellaceae bacterium]